MKLGARIVTNFLESSAEYMKLNASGARTLLREKPDKKQYRKERKLW